MAIRVVKGGDSTVEDGTYDAVVEGLEERCEEEKHYYLMFFRLTSGRHQGMRLSGLASPVLEEGSGLDIWLTAILAREVEVGEELDLDVLLPGKRCRFRVKNVTKAGRRYSNVVRVLPSRA